MRLVELLALTLPVELQIGIHLIHIRDIQVMVPEPRMARNRMEATTIRLRVQTDIARITHMVQVQARHTQIHTATTPTVADIRIRTQSAISIAHSTV